MQRVPDTTGRERMWKLVSTITGMLVALLVRKSTRTAYRAIRKDKATTPFDPTNTWPDALLWAAAAGIGLGIGKVVSARVAFVGWKAVTGTLPPGAVEEPAVV